MRNFMPLPIVPLLLLAAACGDDGTRDTDSASGTSTSGASTISTTSTATDSVPTTAGPDGSGSGTTTGVSDSNTGNTGGTGGTGTTTTGGPVSGTTTDASSTDISGSSSGTTQACVCAPGETNGCEGADLLVCAEDCLGFAAAPCPMGQQCKGDACTAQLCVPGSTVCENDEQVKTCNGQGEAYDPPVNCAPTEGCAGGSCLSLCAQAEATPSSIGCSFFAERMDNYNNEANDSLIIGNTSKIKAATVQLYFTANGQNVEAAQGAPVVIMPGKTQTYTLTNMPFAKASGYRKGGSYRIQSTIPVVAYQHSPIGAQATNDASMLLPEHALKQDYIVASYQDGLDGVDLPSYFTVVATADGTTVKWTPTQSTSAGNGVAAVAAGKTGQQVMNRFDTLQLRAPDNGDLSGSFVTADKPIWVVGANNCANVPSNETYCDHIEEQLLPLDYWGKKYVGAHSPKRGTEKHYWRVYAGEDATTITTDPPQQGTPVILNKGQWKELVIANNTSFIFESDKPFLPVQYLEGEDGGAGTGDPAMYQMIPVEQFLDRYAFVTGTGYSVHYAQIIRAKGGADVKVDGNVVAGYYAVGDYEVADFKISEGAHLAESDSPFGVINVGYTGVTSYAYPGGLKLEVINPQ
jgi:hypothetical protein